MQARARYISTGVALEANEDMTDVLKAIHFLFQEQKNKDKANGDNDSNSNNNSQECSENSVENDSNWSRESVTDVDTDSGFKDDTESLETRSDTDPEDGWRNCSDSELENNDADPFRKVSFVDFMH